ncbi:disease resistance protein RPV1-like [Lycium barbarum]|uniref:disease resistance protein RPV1-like n=1 Tax=Lycium barbarum TaxID=112863 RepID=UPI00293EDF27|nr:disease resistance protein RPV1-like [Lycium barbarum]
MGENIIREEYSNNIIWLPEELTENVESLCIPTVYNFENDPYMGNLKHLDLSYNHGLTKNPNFGGMPNLETLYLRACENLEDVHPSLGHFRMLTKLNLSGCCKLKKPPELRLGNLKLLNLILCNGLTETPNFGDMPNLETLILWMCRNSKKVHPSLGHCRMLTELNLSGCCTLKKLPELRLSNLKRLDLSWCSGLTETLNFGDMPNLETLMEV